jgi:hypothetical protein
MQIGGSITTIERLRRGCRIRDPDSLWTNFARVVGTLNLFNAFAAQWLASRLPCQRFVSQLTMRCA